MPQEVINKQPTHHNMAPNGSETDAAFAEHNARVQRKKNRTKCLLYIILFVIFHAAVVAIFATTIMRVRTPRLRVLSATFENLIVGIPSNPSLTTRMNAEVSIRNNNFGRYRYHNTTLHFFYRGAAVGEGHVRSSRVNWRATRRVEVIAELRLAGNSSELVSDLGSGVVPITSRARMSGRVDLIFVIRRKRATNMNCSMEIVMATQQLRNIVCN